MRLALALTLLLVGCGSLATKYVHPASTVTPSATVNAGQSHGFTPFTYNRMDGKTRHAFLGTRANAKGTILYLHGNGMLAATSLQPLTFLNGFGMDVAVMEYTGYGPHKGRPSDAQLRKDVAGIVTALRKRQPNKPILMVGSSLGGSLAIITAMDNNIDGLVTLGAFTRTADFAGGAAAQIVKSANAFDALGAAGGITIPWTIVHCKQDRTIPVSHAHRLYSAGVNVARNNGLRSVISDCDDHLVPFPLWKRAIQGVINQNAFYQ
jgi:pimeloyl-ACP methyl ester carboxylesterase